MAGISVHNKQVIGAALKEYVKKICDKAERNCEALCGELCNAAVRERGMMTASNEGHDFTGNLLNSIAVCLYREGQPRNVWYSSGIVKPAIRVKMSSGKRVRFKRDYSGARSSFTPTVATNRGFGKDDAVAFFHAYRPAGKNLLDIVVAYTVEYAKFLEHTSGFLRTRAHAASAAVTTLKIERVA